MAKHRRLLRARPCSKCPFRKDVPVYLRLDRRRQIANSLVVDGQEFWCHETTDWTDEEIEGDDEYTQKGREEICAGAAISLHRDGGSTQLMRIAERISNVDLDKMTAKFPDVWTVREFMSLAEGSTADAIVIEEDVADIETCSVVGPDCLAPAGYLGTGGGVVHGTEAAENRCSLCGEPVCDNCMDGDVCLDCSEEG